MRCTLGLVGSEARFTEVGRKHSGATLNKVKRAKVFCEISLGFRCAFP